MTASTVTTRTGQALKVASLKARILNGILGPTHYHWDDPVARRDVKVWFRASAVFWILFALFIPFVSPGDAAASGLPLIVIGAVGSMLMGFRRLEREVRAKRIEFTWRA